jgi:DNA-binding transcriptional MerR regulator
MSGSAVRRLDTLTTPPLAGARSALAPDLRTVYPAGPGPTRQFVDDEDHTGVSTDGRGHGRGRERARPAGHRYGGAVHRGVVAAHRAAGQTIRYYSDLGLLPVAGRTSAGYRRYDEAAAARLALIRTLRELGLGLAPIRRVLDRQAALADVAAAHADALEQQIRILRLHRSVLRALAVREPDLTEVERMNDIARASAAERHRIQEEFRTTCSVGCASTRSSSS